VPAVLLLRNFAATHYAHRCSLKLDFCNCLFPQVDCSFSSVKVGIFFFSNMCTFINEIGDWEFQTYKRRIYHACGIFFLSVSKNWCSGTPPRKIESQCKRYIHKSMWSDNKVRELITVKVLHTSLLNTTMVAFKVLLLGSYAPMPAPSPPFKQFWNWFCGMAFRAAVVLLLMSSMSSKCPPFNIFFIFGNRKKSLGARSGE